MVHDQRIQCGAASFSRCKAEGGRGGWSVGGLGAVLFLLAAFVLSSSGVDGEPRGVVENPGPHSYQSGIGVISGWVCAADLVEIELNGARQPAAYGTERADTESGGGTRTTGLAYSSTGICWETGRARYGCWPMGKRSGRRPSR